MHINILNNFLSKTYCNILEKLITDRVLPLYYNVKTVRPSPFSQDSKAYLGTESPQFTHMFVESEVTQSSFMTYIDPIILNFASRTEVLNQKKLHRCKLNLNYKDISFDEKECYPLHVDIDNKKGLTAIYYINDSDGDTFFFDSSYHIIEKIKPKQGTIVYFDNQIIHAGSPPKENQYRAVINFNWLEIEDAT